MSVTGIHKVASYCWGPGCTGWVLEDREGWTIKEERMVPGSSEKLHVHRGTRQFFYILEGAARFQLGEEVLLLGSREGVMVAEGIPHQIANDGKESLAFLVISLPGLGRDRIELE